MEMSERPAPDDQPQSASERQEAEALEVSRSFLASWLETHQNSVMEKRPLGILRSIFGRLVGLERVKGDSQYAPEVPPPMYIPKSPTSIEQPSKGNNPERLAEQVAKRVKTYEKAKERPEVVLKEMLKAAEVDAPVERIYERRQEVRDEPSPTNKTSDAVPVGTILRQKVMPLGMPNNQQKNEPSLSTLNQPPIGLYVRAIRGGFYAGLIITALSLLGMILIK